MRDLKPTEGPVWKVKTQSNTHSPHVLTTRSFGTAVQRNLRTEGKGYKLLVLPGQDKRLYTA
eukprot:5669169-Amphidinium_carterae.2